MTTRWEAAAPILLAAGGLGPTEGSVLAEHHLPHEVRVVSRASEVEEALARGGAEAGGADVAIVPLASWVTSYEHLAALSTEVFFVAAWSRGSEVFFLSSNAEPSDRVPASFGLASTRTAPETLSALMLLSEMGASLERVRFTASDAPDALIAASERDGPDTELRARGRLPWMSTADASRLSPWVVIAPSGFVREHQPVLVAWASGWLRGMELLAADVPAAARSIAALEGAPPLVDLLRRLGQVELVGLVEQAQLAGLSGRSYVTLEALFRRAWSVERTIGVLTGPPPETLPIATGTIASLVRRDAPAGTTPPPFRAASEARVIATFPFDAPRSARDVAASDALVARLGFVAGVFPRSGIRVSATRERASALRAIVARAVEQYGLDAARVEVVTESRAGLSVLSPG